MIKKHLIDQLNFDGHHANGKGFDQIFVSGNGSDLFLAVGCSWTRAWGATDTSKSPWEPDYADDEDFMLNKSYAGRLSKQLGFDTFINMAIPGSSIDLQARFMIEFLQKNRNLFNRIFVLWGITSHLRWELYGNVVNKPTMFQFGTRLPPGKEKEFNWFVKHHWNENFELERFGQKIVMAHAYLKLLQVEHLFFPVFESLNQTKMNLNHIDDRNFFMKDSNPNDMMSLWCVENKLQIPKNVSSNPFSETDVLNLSELRNLGYLSQKFAHPTEKGHLDIYNRISNYLANFS
jgi:hypothetical protein